MPSPESTVTTWHALPSAPQLVVALDLDGTLIGYAATPAEAHVDGATAAVVEALAKSPGVLLGIVTGRKRELVEDLPARLPGVPFAAEHGAWRYVNGVWELAAPAVPERDELDRSLTALAARHPGALVERKTCSICLHWRLVATGEREAIESAADAIAEEWLESHRERERLPAVEALEIRHHDANKGAAIAWLRGLAAAGAPPPESSSSARTSSP